MVAHEDNKCISNLAVVVDKTLHLSEVDVTWLSTHGFTHLLYLAFSHSFSLEVSLENSSTDGEVLTPPRCLSILGFYQGDIDRSLVAASLICNCKCDRIPNPMRPNSRN